MVGSRHSIDATDIDDQTCIRDDLLASRYLLVNNLPENKFCLPFGYICAELFGLESARSQHRGNQTNEIDRSYLMESLTSVKASDSFDRKIMAKEREREKTGRRKGGGGEADALYV